VIVGDEHTRCRQKSRTCATAAQVYLADGTRCDHTTLKIGNRLKFVSADDTFEKLLCVPGIAEAVSEETVPRLYLVGRFDFFRPLRPPLMGEFRNVEPWPLDWTRIAEYGHRRSSCPSHRVIGSLKEI
jgi:hypothetical protein